jgi:hypothetical protein
MVALERLELLPEHLGSNLLRVAEIESGEGRRGDRLGAPHAEEPAIVGNEATNRLLAVGLDRRDGVVPAVGDAQRLAIMADGDRIRRDLPGRLDMPYWYGKIRCMKKTLHIDAPLLHDARVASGAKTDTETVRLGLEALVRRAAYERLRALRGSEPRAREIPRRRERPSSARHSAA